MLLAATQANRRAIADAGVIARSSFPLGTKPVLAALADGRDPGADGIVFL